jgi:CDP-glucose 4,6-dehydratase
LGWEPKLKIETALEWTMDWYRAWQSAENMAEFTAKQIAEYEKLCGY